MTVKANPAGAFLGDSDTQNITGAKTFLDSTLKQRNPLNTFTLTTRNPAITADADTRINRPYRYCVFLEGSTVYCQNMQTGRIESSAASSTPETVFQYALTNATKSSIYFGPGNYTVSGSFTGLTFGTETTLVMDQGFLLQLPGGYTGDVFIFPAAANICHVYGGKFSENTTRSNLWTWCHFLGDGGGVQGNVVSGAYVRFAGNVIKVEAKNASGWVNSNTVQDMFADQFVKGIVFVDDGLGSGTNANLFKNVVLQTNSSGGLTTYGVKDVTGDRNVFLNVSVWDSTGSTISCNILSGATYTMILGGIMTNLNFADLGSKTLILEFTTRQIPNWDVQTATAPSSPSAGRVRHYAKATDANNDNPYFKTKINGAVVEVQI